MVALRHVKHRTTPVGATSRTGAIANCPDQGLSRGVGFAFALSLPVWLSLFYLFFG